MQAVGMRVLEPLLKDVVAVVGSSSGFVNSFPYSG